MRVPPLTPGTLSVVVLLTVRAPVLVVVEALIKRACLLVSLVVTWLWWLPPRGAGWWVWRRPAPRGSWLWGPRVWGS